MNAFGVRALARAKRLIPRVTVRPGAVVGQSDRINLDHPPAWEALLKRGAGKLVRSR